ncbi:peroxidase P7-like [Oryza brachyantha]|uniref:peroxidase P7-like n=1 Tax=Oryza brachyantha TaxID=4533 RepID=UPI001ADC45B8|nr:peroxidase P7-like [Oryza brachyantha]
MAFSLSMSFLVGSLALLLLASTGEGKLVLLPAKFSPNYYKKTCPDVQNVVRTVMARRVDMAPAILRLFFHDCFVNGCDASVLLDRTDSMESEKDAEPANKSLAGFDVVDEIKAALEHECPATVSCADILALASRDAVALLGGPSWGVPLGRLDSRRANKEAADGDALPSPHAGLGELLKVFEEHGLDARDLTALSGAHTVGKAHSCENYRDRVYGGEGANDNIDPSFAALRRHSCEQGSGEAPFDEKTPTVFDNRYFQDLLARRGLLTSDQELHTDGGPVSDLVELYATNRKAFFADFAEAMVKMGDMRPPMLMPVEVRLNCRMVNY